MINPEYSTNFIDISFVDDDGSTMDPLDGCADNLNINCIDSIVNKTIIKCSDTNPFPLIGIAEATQSDDYLDINPYAYRYKLIDCGESDNCYINCSGSQSCYYTYFQGDDTSKIDLNCNSYPSSSCYGSIIQSVGYNVNVLCSGDLSCNEMIISSQGTANIELLCNSNTETVAGCSNINISTDSNVSITCNDHSSCQYVNAVSSYNDVILNCYDVASCEYMIINGYNNISIECNASYSCSRLNVIGNGDLYTRCMGDYSCSNSRFYINGSVDNNNNSNYLECIGDYSCHQIVFGSNNIDYSMFNCNGYLGCQYASITTTNYIDGSLLQFMCNDTYACQYMNIITDAIPTMICNANSSCANASIQQIKSISNSIMNVYCNLYESCHYIQVISDIDINLNCLGINSCIESSIRAVNSNIQCDCQDYSSCSSSSLIADNNILLFCSESSCQNGKYSGNGFVSITCNSSSSCINSQILNYGIEYSNTTVNCLDSLSCQYLQISSTEDIYVNSIAQQAANGMIVHGIMTSNVYINCLTDASCYPITVYANYDISLTCKGRSSCFGSDITGNTLNIDCNGYSSCNEMLIQSENSLQLDCISSSSCMDSIVTSIGTIALNCLSTSSCQSSTVYCKSSFYNSCNINCIGDQSCMDTTIGIPNVFINGFIDLSSCNNNNTCLHMQFDCNDNKYPFIWNNELNKYQCSNSGCCPWDITQETNNTYIVPQSFNQGILDCRFISTISQNPYYPKYDCSYYNIDASMIDSLTINCLDTNTCFHTNITCSATKCVINCDGDGSCLLTSMNALTVNEFDLECCGDESYYNYPCSSMQINAINATNINLLCKNHACTDNNIIATYVSNSFYLESNDLNGISSEINIDVNYGNNININCASGLCSGLNINANYANNIYINCQSSSKYENICRDLTLYAQNVSNLVSVQFGGRYSAINGLIDASFAKYLNIIYSADNKYDNNDKVTEQTMIIIPNNMNSTNLICINYGCYFTQFESYNNGGLDNINVEFNGKCNCTSIDDCINDWNITCDGISAQFDGNKCTVDNCCDEKTIQLIQNSFDDYSKIQKCNDNHHNNNNNNLSGGAVGLIIVGVFLFLVAIRVAVWHCRKETQFKQESLLINK